MTCSYSSLGTRTLAVSAGLGATLVDLEPEGLAPSIGAVMTAFGLGTYSILCEGTSRMLLQAFLLFFSSFDFLLRLLGGGLVSKCSEQSTSARGSEEFIAFLVGCRFFMPKLI